MTREFGTVLREYRLRAGLTQEELAARAGISTHAIGMLEAGRRRPRLSSVGLLATAFGLDQAGREDLISAARARTAEPADPAVPRMLPFAVPDFTGRRLELDRLLGLAAAEQGGLAGGTVVISAIDGMAGIGKTTLAVQACRELAAGFPDGQLFLDLHGFTPGETPLEPAAALARLLRTVGVGDERMPVEAEERAQLWRSEVADRRLLIVLDNAVDAAQVRQLIPAGRGSLVLITSRRRMPALAGAVGLSLDVLSDQEAVQLFTRIVGAERLAGHPGEVAEIVTLCGLLPLAVRIAAARLAHRPAWTPAHLLARLREQHRLPAVLSVEDQSVAAAFAVSYRSLGPQQRRLFRLAALHPGADLTADAFAALAGLPPAAAENLLDDLHDQHLLIEHAPGRYTFHDLVRRYATERLAEDEPAEAREAALDHLLAWYLNSADAAARVMTPQRRHAVAEPVPAGRQRLEFGSYEMAQGWLDAEHRNLLAALESAAATGRHDTVVRLPVALWELFNHRGHWNDWITACTLGLASARETGDGGAEATMLIDLGSALNRAGRPAEAIEWYEAAIALRQAQGDVRGEATARFNLGAAYYELQRLTESTGMMEAALALHRSVGNRFGEGATLSALGQLATDLGETDRGLGLLEAAVTVYQETGDRFNAAIAFEQLGQLLCNVGRLAEAEAALRSGIEANREVGHRHSEGVCWEYLGRALAARGEREPAAAAFRQAQALLAELDPGAQERIAALLTPLH